MKARVWVWQAVAMHPFYTSHPASSAGSLICCVKPGLGLHQTREAKLHWSGCTFYTDNCQHDTAQYLKNVFAYLLCARMHAHMK